MWCSGFGLLIMEKMAVVKIVTEYGKLFSMILMVYCTVMQAGCLAAVGRVGESACRGRPVTGAATALLFCSILLFCRFVSQMKLKKL